MKELFLCRTPRLVLFSLFSLLNLAACQVSSSVKSAAFDLEDHRKTESLSIEALDFAYSPDMDILFVIDISGSMEKHQIKLRKNIHRFTEKIIQSRIIDFQIGVTSTRWVMARRYKRTTKGVAHPSMGQSLAEGVPHEHREAAVEGAGQAEEHIKGRRSNPRPENQREVDEGVPCL